MWSRVTNWSHADTDTAQCSSHTSGQSSGSARAGDSFIGLMCVLWSRAVNCQLWPDSLTCHYIAKCHKSPDLIPTQPLVRLMENIDFWLPASSISPLSRVCRTKWSGVTIAVSGHKLCPGDKPRAAQRLLCVQICHLCYQEPSEDRELTQVAGCEVSAALYTCCVSDKCDIFSLVSFLPGPETRHMSRLWAVTWSYLSL